MYKKLTPFVAVGFAVVSSQTAFGQTAVDPRADSRTTDPQPSLQPKGEASTQFLLQNNGGSLLQATEPQTSSTGLPTAMPLSLIEVPEAAPHVLKKHDLVNIVVQESSKSESTGTMDLKKNVDFDAKVDAFVKLSLARFSVIGGAEGAKPPEIKAEGQRDSKGEGTYDRTDTVSLRLEAEVIDVKPNGNLVIQARRHIKTDEEDIAVSLTGTCRVLDVDATNSVLSTDLHDLDLQKLTKGAVADRTKRGLLPRLLDFINPF